MIHQNAACNGWDLIPGQSSPGYALKVVSKPRFPRELYILCLGLPGVFFSKLVGLGLIREDGVTITTVICYRDYEVDEMTIMPIMALKWESLYDYNHLLFIYYRIEMGIPFFLERFHAAKNRIFNRGWDSAEMFEAWCSWNWKEWLCHGATDTGITRKGEFCYYNSDK